MNWITSAESAHAAVTVPFVGLTREAVLHPGASCYTLEMPCRGPEAIYARSFDAALAEADYVLRAVGYLPAR